MVSDPFRLSREGTTLLHMQVVPDEVEPGQDVGSVIE
jgi:hypothetical protein